MTLRRGWELPSGAAGRRPERNRCKLRRRAGECRNPRRVHKVQLAVSILVKYSSGFGVLAAAAVLLLTARLSDAQQATDTKPVVLVELFTSEGCSSCPPADRWLIELQERQPVAGVEVIALGEHVDYWDGLGWRDPFSSAELTGRQRDYSLHFGQNRVYTPQMIVDGAEEFVGSDKREARQAIQRAASRAKARVRITPDSAAGKTARWTIHVDGLPPKAPPRVDVYVAVTESGLANEVKNGENRGRRLEHSSVVRVLQKIGEMGGAPPAKFEHHVELPFDSSWNKENLRVVAFVQEPKVGRVLGAASAPVAVR